MTKNLFTNKILTLFVILLSTTTYIVFIGVENLNLNLTWKTYYLLIVICYCILIFVNESFLWVIFSTLLFLTIICLEFRIQDAAISNDFIDEPIDNLLDSTGYKYSMFFFESNYIRREMTTKEMCAIESAAKTNPNALIQVHSFSARLNIKARKLLKVYPNIKIIAFNPERIFNDTPILQWWNSGIVLKSPYSFSHLTDAFRMTVMWKYGGVYSDLDTVTLKSFQGFLDEGRNGFGYMYENYVDLGVGVLVFQPKSPFMRYVVEKFPRIYKPNEWGTNGPILFAQSLLEYCEIDSIHRNLLPGYKVPSKKTKFVTRRINTNQTPVHMDKKHKCADLNIFPQHYFYPFSLIEQKYFAIFKKNSSFDAFFWKAINGSYSVHYYGKASSHQQTRPIDKSFYSALASKYCDFTLNYVKQNNLSFY